MIISREDYDRVMDPGKRDPVIEAARKATLARVAAKRAAGELPRGPDLQRDALEGMRAEELMAQLAELQRRPVCPRCLSAMSDQTRGVWVCQTCKLG